jgi:hypothetical protein
MFVALKNWRERLKHRGGDFGDRLLAGAERTLGADAYGSVDLLRHFRAAALAPRLSSAEAPPLVELGPQFAGARPLSSRENLSIMGSVKRGVARG